jgi:hypothetical protein
LLQLEPATVQSIVQVLWLTLHDVHPVGQLFPGASPLGASIFPPGASIVPGKTQKPLSQTVPWCAVQSVDFVQENSWLLWLTEHPSAASTIKTAIAFIEHLRS